MDILAEVESMALNISDVQEIAPEEADIARWHRLFGYGRAEAIRRIEAYRSDDSRTRISDELWATVGSRKEAEGYNQEAYEDEYTLKNGWQARSGLTACPTVSGTFIVQLTGPLASPEKIKDAAGLGAAPAVATGVGEDGHADFC